MDEEAIFHQALEKPPNERGAFLDQACGGDLELRRRLLALLQAHDNPDRRFASWAMAVTVSEATFSEEPATQIGPYKLLEKLGEGGMGSVYAAEQEEPVKRRVALKIIKSGMDSGQILRRFDAERQALALMDHPNIARVFDAGTTDAGRPYFVMELVKGDPITAFCDREHLSPQARLSLFLDVCRAVQHAHQKGVIHRDLKPSNILVALYDGKPVPKVIDFGLAKAVRQNLSEQTVFTEIGQIVGTLEYMSPEQAELNNLDVDTRTDVYALGVVLYELLAGSPPFTARQLRGAAFTEMLRMIREVDPPKPSTKLSSSEQLPVLAANRKLEPKELTRLVQGDLDWIAMKCLSKDRARRYETANELALDVERYLADEPVLAGPPSKVYRLRKFIKRNRGSVSAAAAVALTLLIGIAGTTWGLFVARRETGVAKHALSSEETQRKKADSAARAALESAKSERIAHQQAEINLGLAKAARDQAELEKRAAKSEAYRAECANHANRFDLALRACQQHDVLHAEQILDDVMGTFQQTWEARHLRDFVNRSAAVLVQGAMTDPGPVNANGTRILGTLGPYVRVWDASNGRETLTLEAGFFTNPKGVRDSYPRCQALMSDDGSTIVSMSGNESRPNEIAEFKVWDGITGKERRSIKAPLSDLNRLALAGNGKRVAAIGGKGRDPGKLKMWDTETGSELFALDGPFATAALNADGQSLVAASGTDVTIRDGRSGAEKRSLKGHKLPVNWVWISGDGRRVASNDGREAKIWDGDTGKELCSLVGHQYPMTSVQVCGDARRVLTIDGYEAKIWDGATGKQIHSLKAHDQSEFPSATKANDADSPDIGNLALSDDGRTLVSWLSTSSDRLPPPTPVTLYDSQTGRKTLSLKGHSGLVSRAQICKDGRHIVSTSGNFADPIARVWSLDADEAALMLKGHKGAVLCVAVSHDGSRIASGGEDGTVKLRDASTGEEQATLKGHSGEVRSVLFSADDRYLLSGGGPLQGGIVGDLIVWDTATRQTKLTQHSALPIFSVAASADSRSIVTGGGTRGAGELPAFGELIVWEWDGVTARPKRTLGVPERDRATGKEINSTLAINAVAISPDGRLVVSACVDGSLKLWDAESGRERFSLEKYPQGVVTSLAISADGQKLVSGSSDQTVKLWDTRSGELKRTLHGHTDEVNGVALGADGQRLISAGADKTVKLWDAKTGQEMLTLKGHADSITGVAMSAVGESIVTGSKDQTVKVWRAPATDELLFLKGHTQPVQSVALSADGTRVVSGGGRQGTGEPGEIIVWDAQSGLELLTLKSPTNGIERVGISADGGRIVSVSLDGTVVVWDVASGRSILTCPGRYSAAAISADGRQIVAALDRDEKPGIVQLFDVTNGRPRLSLPGHKGRITALAMSADGQKIVAKETLLKPTELPEEEFTVWDAATGKAVFTRKGGAGSLVLSADGEWLVFILNGRDAMLWDTRTGQEVRKMKPPAGFIESLAIDARGERVVLGATDGSLKLWHPQTQQELIILKGRKRPITCVAISANGKRIVSGGTDNMVTVWRGPEP